MILLSLKQFLIAAAQKLKNLDDNKVDKTSCLTNLDVNAGTATIDGKLVTALNSLGWLSDVTE